MESPGYQISFLVSNYIIGACENMDSLKRQKSFGHKSTTPNQPNNK